MHIPDVKIVLWIKNKKRRLNNVKRLFKLLFLRLGVPLLLVYILIFHFDWTLLTIAWAEKNPIPFWIIVILIIVAIILLYIFRPSFKFKKPEKKNDVKKEGAVKDSIVKDSNGRSVDTYVERPLLTETENKFYQYLSKDLEEYDVVIHPKVRLEDLAKTTADTREEFRKARNYIKSRHIDFTLCNHEMEVICCIEVDDDSHESPEAKEIDDFKNRLFNRIHKPLYRVVKMDQLEEGARIIAQTLIDEKKVVKK